MLPPIAGGLPGGAPALSRVTGWNIGLLAAGMGLIAASCVSAVRLAAGGAQGPAVYRVELPVSGQSAVLRLPEAVTAAPVVRLESRRASGTAGLRYLFEMTPPEGGEGLRRRGTAELDGTSAAAIAERPGGVSLQFPASTFEAGRWRARFETVSPGAAIERIELRLAGAGPGLLAGLITTLTLAILGWLSASLGALRWIRAEAARDAAGGGEAPGAAGRSWIVACHLSALLGYVVPFGHLLGPLAVWLAKRDSLPAVERAGRAALNFQLSFTFYVLVGLFLSFFLIGLGVLLMLVVVHFAAVVHAALRARRGAAAVYPLTLQLI